MAENYKVAYYKRVREEFDERAKEVERRAEKELDKISDEFSDLITPWVVSLNRADMLDFIHDSEIGFADKVHMMGAYAIANRYDVEALMEYSKNNDDLDEIERLIVLAERLLEFSGFSDK